MQLMENAGMAVGNLRGNKARSALTMLGVIIGVGAVIALVSLGEGARRQITESITAMGSNLLIVSPSRENPRGLDDRTVALLEEASACIDRVAPAVWGGETVAAAGRGLETNIIGCTPAYAEVRNYRAAYGRFFNADEDAGARRVAVIGRGVADELFPGINPIGEEIRVGRVRLEVVGVLAEKGQSAFGNGDDLVLLPLETARERIFGNKRLSEINLRVRGEEYVDPAFAQVNAALLQEFGAEDQYHLNNMTEMLSAAQDMTRTMTMLLAGIAAVSLLVGGIGIMNIMLVSVTERIREIGIRKAIGAQPEEILVLFLLEAVALSLGGGLIGIGVGAGLAFIVGKSIGWAITVSLGAVLTAFLFSLGVGLFFGVYPAYRASGLHPIEALRHE